MSFAVLALLTVCGLYVTYDIQATSRVAVLESDEVWRAEIGAYRQTSEMHELAMDLRFITGSSSLAGWLASGDASGRAELEKDFLALATTNAAYDQIRYLDGKGREIIRVDRDRGKLVVVRGDQLQDKSDRYYFTQSLKLRPGQIYISPLDLNVEHGAIEQPIKPTLRLGASVLDANGQVQGVVILNYNARDLFNRLRKLALAGKGDPWLLNKAGYWLIGPPDAEWAFMYPDRPQRTFAQTYSGAWQEIVTGPASGQFMAQGDLLTYAKVPFPSEADSHDRSLGAGQADTDWARIFLAVVPAGRLSELKWEVARPFLVIGAILLPLFGFAAFAGTDQYARRRAAEFQREESEIRERAEKLASVNLEQRVTERTAELQASNRELEAFCYSVSHDLRSPLRVIDGFSQILEQDCGPHIGDSGKDNVTRIRKAAQRMGGLIDDLLNLSRISRYDLYRKDVDLSAQVREILEELKGLAPERQVELAIADGIKAHGDARLLRIAIDNLIGNAWKFTQDRVPARIEFGQTEIDGEMAYYVRDNGAGFDMQYAGKLFGAFQRLHNGHEFSGHGIGLAIVQRVIVKHGGRVWAKAQPEQGATFYFTL